MNHHELPPPVNGAAMDSVVKKNSHKNIYKILLLILLFISIVFSFRLLMPDGLQVNFSDVLISKVERGSYLDNIVIRGNAVPLNSVILDSLDSGRVEEVLVLDGAFLKQGDQIFRMSNAQRHLELLQRQSEYTQQITNLAMLRVSYETSRSNFQQRLTDLKYNVSQTRNSHNRNIQLREQGFLSEQAINESNDKLSYQKSLLSELESSSVIDLEIRKRAVEEVEGAIKRLQVGLTLVSKNVEALDVRAPASGRLTDFRLQVGETVKSNQYLGRIDDPSRYKLSAQVDEYYLSRLSVGEGGQIAIDGKTFKVKVARIFPQIKDARFLIELEFDNQPPSGLNPGKSLDVTISLSEPAPALILPSGPFVNETGGAWVFVVSSDGKNATKRTIKIGRRSNTQIEILSGLNAGEKVVISSYSAFEKFEKLQFKQ